MNVEIGAEAALFPEKENINGIAVAVHPAPPTGSHHWWGQFLPALRAQQGLGMSNLTFH